MPRIGPQKVTSLYMNKSESSLSKHVSQQVWLNLAKWFLRRSRLKEKVNRRTDAVGSGDLKCVLSMFARHTSLSFNSRCEIISHIYALAYKYD